MKVTLQFEAQLRQVAGFAETEIETESGASVLDALQKVVSCSSDELRHRILADDGSLQPTVLLFVDDQAVPTDLAGTTTLSDNSRVLVLPPISGG